MDKCVADRKLLAKLIIAELITKSLVFYGNRNLSVVSANARHWTWTAS